MCIRDRDGVLCPLRVDVADAAEEFADADALGEDLGVGGLERVLGVERPFTPGCFLLLVASSGESLSRCCSCVTATGPPGRSPCRSTPPRPDGWGRCRGG